MLEVGEEYTMEAGYYCTFGTNACAIQLSKGHQDRAAGFTIDPIVRCPSLCPMPPS